MRPVDYVLLDVLDRARAHRERTYVCTMWDWLKDFRDAFWKEGWWQLTILYPGPQRGHVYRGGKVVLTEATHGEIETAL